MVNDILHRGDRLFALDSLNGQEPEAMQGVIATPQPEDDEDDENIVKAEQEPEPKSNSPPAPAAPAHSTDMEQAVPAESKADRTPEPNVVVKQEPLVEAEETEDPDDILQKQIREQSELSSPLKDNKRPQRSTSSRHQEAEDDIAKLMECFD